MICVASDQQTFCDAKLKFPNSRIIAWAATLLHTYVCVKESTLFLVCLDTSSFARAPTFVDSAHIQRVYQACSESATLSFASSSTSASAKKEFSMYWR